MGCFHSKPTRTPSGHRSCRNRMSLSASYQHSREKDQMRERAACRQKGYKTPQIVPRELRTEHDPFEITPERWPRTEHRTTSSEDSCGPYRVIPCIPSIGYTRDVREGNWKHTDFGDGAWADRTLRQKVRRTGRH